MKITGIICEYNPLHLGHIKQLSMISKENPDGGIVCLMSGNYVQRGAPAIFDKSLRAAAAIDCGADLVLELPVTASLSSAEGFASQGVRILGSFCDRLSFGAENADGNALLNAAKALNSPEFSQHLQPALESGVSFPAARQIALEQMGIDSAVLQSPNTILAVEYCKAILAQGLSMEPAPILREGNYHDISADPENPSATALRLLIENGGNWLDFVPRSAASSFENATVHTLSAGEKAILYRLRTMTDAEFETLPYGSEGLWRKLMKNARSLTTLEDILTATKSKRYTRSRLDRMVLCAVLGLTAQDIASPAPYVRVLGFSNKGRKILVKARQSGCYPNIGEKQASPYQTIENRCDDLYGLFAKNTPEAPGTTGSKRIYYSHPDADAN